MAPEPVKVLTIGGSDSGGAAGVQADLKTMTALGAYGMSAITAVTAQDSRRVAAVHYLPPPFIGQQIDTVLADYGAAAIKTGFLGQVDIVHTVAERLAAIPTTIRIVDPVLVNQHQAPMFGPDLVAAYRARLLPVADLLTPNCAEAALLSERPVTTPVQMQAAARALRAAGARAVLITGLRDDGEMVDYLLAPDAEMWRRGPRLATTNTHGSGDTFSAALAVFLARGRTLSDALTQAHTFTRRAIQAAAGWRLGGGHGPLAQWAAGAPEA